MAQIVDYPTLVSAVTDYFDRAADTTFTGRIDTFIGLAEDTFTPVLTNRRAETTASLTTADDGSVALPTDFYRFRSLYGVVNGSNTLLPMIGPSAVPGLYPINSTDTPVYGQIVGDTLYVVPNQAQTVTLDYYAQLAGLTVSNPTNWLITDHPTLYLMATMAQAALWLQDFTTAANFDAKANTILQQLTDYMAIDYYNAAEVVLDTVTP